MERLTVKNLGPLKDFTLETNRLTVIIGPQASGKSLLAQMLFFFKEFKPWLVGNYPFPVESEDWMEEAVREFLSRLRGVPISNYIGENSTVCLGNGGNKYSFEFKSKRFNDVLPYYVINLNDALKEDISAYVNDFFDTSKVFPRWIVSNGVYIPTERSLYTRLVSSQRSAIYSRSMPYTIKKFADQIDECSNEGGFVHYHSGELHLVSKRFVQVYKRVAEQQRKALGGEIKLSVGGLPVRQFWTWSIEGKEEDRFPLEGMSSGQMETWPFFVLAAVFGSKKEPHDFYFEEPETHLHPRAQVEVIRTIAYLISLGHRFVITTHSPFILYIINTLIQAHIAYDGAVPEGEFSIDPGHVAAYSLGEKAGSIVNPETRLLDLTEIDSVFDEINVSFGKYMDMEFAKHEK